VQARVEVGETSTKNLAIIEIDREQENVVFVLKLKEDEHVIGHVEIDACDIFILTSNLLPTHPFYLRRWVGFFLANLCSQ
jgi:hypothetical protein